MSKQNTQRGDWQRVESGPLSDWDLPSAEEWHDFMDKAWGQDFYDDERFRHHLVILLETAPALLNVCKALRDEIENTVDVDDESARGGSIQVSASVAIDHYRNLCIAVDAAEGGDS